MVCVETFKLRILPMSRISFFNRKRGPHFFRLIYKTFFSFERRPLVIILGSFVLFVDCTADEFDCQDGNCISLSLKCNKVNNCVTASDEDAEECKVQCVGDDFSDLIFIPRKLYYNLLLQEEQSFWEQLSKIDLLIILIVFFVILFGMCFTLIFNVVRKLIHDFSVIKVK